MALPTYQGSGTFTASATTPQPPFPASDVLVGDIAILVAESENQAITLSSAQGFVEIGTGAAKAAGSAATDPANRIAVFWKRVAIAGGGTAPTLADSGNHTTGQIHTFRGCKTSGNPWDVFAEGNHGAATTSPANIPGATTTIPNALVLLICGTSNNANATDNFASWTNAALANIQERADNSNTIQLGGGHGLATGEKATAGDYGTSTVANSTTTYKGTMSIALVGNLDSVAVDAATSTVTGASGATVAGAAQSAGASVATSVGESAVNPIRYCDAQSAGVGAATAISGGTVASGASCAGIGAATGAATSIVLSAAQSAGASVATSVGDDDLVAGIGRSIGVSVVTGAVASVVLGVTQSAGIGAASAASSSTHVADAQSAGVSLEVGYGVSATAGDAQSVGVSLDTGTGTSLGAGFATSDGVGFATSDGISAGVALALGEPEGQGFRASAEGVSDVLGVSGSTCTSDFQSAGASIGSGDGVCITPAVAFDLSLTSVTGAAICVSASAGDSVSVSVAAGDASSVCYGAGQSSSVSTASGALTATALTAGQASGVSVVDALASCVLPGVATSSGVSVVDGVVSSTAVGVFTSVGMSAAFAASPDVVGFAAGLSFGAATVFGLSSTIFCSDGISSSVSDAFVEVDESLIIVEADMVSDDGYVEAIAFGARTSTFAIIRALTAPSYKATPNAGIRMSAQALVDTPVYYFDFEPIDAALWTIRPQNSYIAAPSHSGTQALWFQVGFGTSHLARRTLTGLIPGETMRIKMWLNFDGVGSSRVAVTLGVNRPLTSWAAHPPADWEGWWLWEVGEYTPVGDTDLLYLSVGAPLNMIALLGVDDITLSAFRMGTVHNVLSLSTARQAPLRTFATPAVSNMCARGVAVVTAKSSYGSALSFSCRAEVV